MSWKMSEIVIRVWSKIYNLLRWPGGKTRACRYIVQILPDTIDRIVSPFFGGGSFEIMAGRSGIEVIGYDIDKGLVALWQWCIRNPVKLAEVIRSKFYPIKTKEQYSELRTEVIGGKYRGIELGAAYFALIRSAHGGNVATGGFNNPGDVVLNRRFTESSIKRVSRFSCPGLVSVNKMDFRTSIQNHPNDFLYLDPPYDIKTPIYMGHSDFPHEELASLLRTRGNWVCFYNNSGDIPKLFKGFRYIPLKWKYSLSIKATTGKKKSDEILIVSDDFPVEKALSNGFLVERL